MSLFFLRFFSDKEDQFSDPFPIRIVSFGKTVLGRMRSIHGFLLYMCVWEEVKVTSARISIRLCMWGVVFRLRPFSHSNGFLWKDRFG